jgi:3-hydroxybutyryl-CoA dehydrogenase
VLAAGGLGTTSPNPVVGCVILDSGGAVAGEGFHAYAAGGVAVPAPAPGPLAGAVDSAGITLGEFLLSAHLNDALRMVQEGYATAADVDTAMRLGCGYPRGPIELAREVGAARLDDRLAAIGSLGLEAGRPAPLA